MNLWYLKPGHKIRTRDGAEAEVVSETEDGEWIRVRYLNNENALLFAGTDDLVHRDEVEVLLGTAKKDAGVRRCQPRCITCRRARSPSRATGR